jgi:hypothetical protein
MPLTVHAGRSTPRRHAIPGFPLNLPDYDEGSESANDAPSPGSESQEDQRQPLQNQPRESRKTPRLQYRRPFIEVVQLADLPADERMCVICYNDYGVEAPEGYKEIPLRLPKCKHVFGSHCIKEWFETADNCPYCRTKLQPSFKKTNPYVRLYLNSMRVRSLVPIDSTGALADEDDARDLQHVHETGSAQSIVELEDSSAEQPPPTDTIPQPAPMASSRRRRRSDRDEEDGAISEGTRGQHDSRQISPRRGSAARLARNSSVTLRRNRRAVDDSNVDVGHINDAPRQYMHDENRPTPLLWNPLRTA